LFGFEVPIIVRTPKPQCFTEVELRTNFVGMVIIVVISLIECFLSFQMKVLVVAKWFE
jgi:hypothetical protein